VQANFIPVNAAKTEFILRFPFLQPVDVFGANNNPASLLKFAQTFAQPGGGIFGLVCSGNLCRAFEFMSDPTQGFTFCQEWYIVRRYRPSQKMAQ
jgi:hypothetical protein